MAHKMAEAGVDQDMVFAFFQFSKAPKQIFQRRLQIKAAVYRRIWEESTYVDNLSGGVILTQTHPPRLARMAGVERQDAELFIDYIFSLRLCVRRSLSSLDLSPALTIP
jgi:hypothetical protein